MMIWKERKQFSPASTSINSPIMGFLWDDVAYQIGVRDHLVPGENGVARQVGGYDRGV